MSVASLVDTTSDKLYEVFVEEYILCSSYLMTHDIAMLPSFKSN